MGRSLPATTCILRRASLGNISSRWVKVLLTSCLNRYSMAMRRWGRRHSRLGRRPPRYRYNFHRCRTSMLSRLKSIFILFGTLFYPFGCWPPYTFTTPLKLIPGTNTLMFHLFCFAMLSESHTNKIKYFNKIWCGIQHLYVKLAGNWTCRAKKSIYSLPGCF